MPVLVLTFEAVSSGLQFMQKHVCKPGWRPSKIGDSSTGYILCNNAGPLNPGLAQEEQ